ncbi:sensor histidine kinase [Dapis sp. BLCC M229]|uniref:sensor histidine kinase n=1 Tax=Dapis sp. BLCC M229 TaxID=3400188 RepID=UPI003CF42B71
MSLQPKFDSDSSPSRPQLLLKWLPWLLLILSLGVTWVVWQKTDRLFVSSTESSTDYGEREIEKTKQQKSVLILANGLTISCLLFGLTWSMTTTQYRATAIARVMTQVLSDKEQQLRTIITNAPIILFTLDCNGIFTLFEGKNVKLTSQQLDEILGLSIYDVYQDQPQLLEANNCALRGKNAEAIAKFGDLIFNTRWSPLKRENDVIFGVIGVATDITERQKLINALQKSEAKSREKAEKLQQTLNELIETQAQLIQAEKLSSLGQLVAGIAHEVNNPINFLKGNLYPANNYLQDLLELVNLYQKKIPIPGVEISQKIEEIELEFLSEDLPKVLNSMHIATDRICELVKSLKNFSRLDEADMKPVDIHSGIDSTLLILNHRLKEKQNCPAIQVLKEYADLPKVECYPGQLNQVFMNILANGIDALEESVFRGKNSAPQIRVMTKLIDEKWVMIKICDNGIGIPKNVQSKLFDPFFTTKPIGKGTGLGLSISYNIVVEKHKGLLKCVSSPSQGTEFTIEIPTRN